MVMTHHEASELAYSARSLRNGKPLEHATRLFIRDGGKIAVQFHATDVVTINEDGTFTLANGGWNTPTTSVRLRRYSPVKLLSERGEWFVRLEPNPKDPAPAYFDRSIPKPFTATDPGPEPVKSDVGCIAGSNTAEPYNEMKRIFDYNWSEQPGPGIHVTSRYYPDGSGPVRFAHVAGIERIFYGEKPRGYYDELWFTFTGKKHFEAGERAEIDGKTIEYKQCPHCAAFDRVHAAWSFRYNGSGWARGINDNKGYKRYVEMMKRFGSVESWQEAYIADFRARREYLKLNREWEERNRVPFFDGITVNSEGYAPRIRRTGPSPAKLRRHEAQVAKMQKRIDKFVDGYIKQLVKGMPMPGGGDCWFCLFRDTKTGETWGDKHLSHGDGDSHLMQHMQDRYYVPTLAVNALRERGYKDVGIYMWLDMNADAGTMGGKDTGRNPYGTVRRDLRRYLSKRLIPNPPTN